MGMAVFVHQHTVSHPGTNIESSLIPPFGEGDSLNSFGRKSAKICSEEFKKKKNKGNPCHMGKKPAADRQPIPPQPVTPGGKAQAVMVCEGVLRAISCLWK